MAKLSIPEVLPVSPVSLECPHCKAKPGKDCDVISGRLAVVHLARLEAALTADLTQRA